MRKSPDAGYLQKLFIASTNKLLISKSISLGLRTKSPTNVIARRYFRRGNLHLVLAGLRLLRTSQQAKPRSDAEHESKFFF